ncbi:mitochondrial potassium channel ATP-binding subunit [Bombina bombina]|uniref:mitochondrial potassium channel ATP-binding subunit n=1 Tax=Bombina bombina TaxID=8345 RepID=UPI00235AB15D|nr:mitochondrial potassium channel ATP-binding subunit [Bombina bombina]
MLTHLLQCGLRRCPPRARFGGLDIRLSTLSRPPTSSSLRLYVRLRDALLRPSRFSNRPFSKGRILALLVGPASACAGGRVVLCQLEHSNHPMITAEKAIPEPEFNWSEFWKLLRPQLLALMTAVILSFGAAVLNIQIPLILGELVNVVSRFTREHAGNYLREVQGPAMRLLCLYGVQVGAVGYSGRE